MLIDLFGPCPRMTRICIQTCLYSWWDLHNSAQVKQSNLHSTTRLVTLQWLHSMHWPTQFQPAPATFLSTTTCHSDLRGTFLHLQGYLTADMSMDDQAVEAGMTEPKPLPGPGVSLLKTI